MRVVVDTNIVVSGLLSPAGPPGRVIDLLLSGHVVALYDDRILLEYHDVLARPKLRIDPALAGAVLDWIERGGILVSAPPLDIELPDPDDLAFIEVAVAGAAAALVTGNGRHFAPARSSISLPILSPADFIALWHTEAQR
ncbi:MAG TPA: putative toxin-antitoxin system toxin component, PIN family [Longimicrobium sp.]